MASGDVLAWFGAIYPVHELRWTVTAGEESRPQQLLDAYGETIHVLRFYHTGVEDVRSQPVPQLSSQVNPTELYINYPPGQRAADSHSYSGVIDIFSSITSSSLSRIHIAFTNLAHFKDGAIDEWGSRYLDVMGFSDALPRMDTLFARFAGIPRRGICPEVRAYYWPLPASLHPTTVQEGAHHLARLMKRKMSRCAARRVLDCIFTDHTVKHRFDQAKA
ncbi:hypothetical protein FOMPIDRAFT_1020144 [Fomitopsis schrenkii]|uniref:Uncharacterized protein n=1 Tax=Fomitopsis schrenkii TaxID=2126942 RepID=S8DL83_FOMSC|nr:hypothetical protein FOMPIDRAFT_1020144 [Fomitopsis schrenkii]